MIGAVVLWWVVIGVRRAATGRPAPSLATWRAVLPAGLFFGLNITLFFTALDRTSIAHAEFITALSPLVLVPLGAVLLQRAARPPGARCGACCRGRPGHGAVPRRQPGRGLARRRRARRLVVCTWVGYLLTGRRARATVDVVDFMSTMMPIGVLTAAPVAIVLAGDDIWPLSAKGWIAVACCRCSPA